MYLLFIRQVRNHATAGSVCTNAKERAKQKKGIETQSVKSPTPTQKTDVLIGGEEQNETQLPWTIRASLTTHRIHTVSLFFYIYISIYLQDFLGDEQEF